jgi:peroxiredoxin
MKPYLFSTLLLIGVALTSRAADRPAVSWADLPGIDGKTHALADLKDRAVVVVAVTRNRCPMAVRYFQKMNEFATSQKSAALVAINLEADDDLEGMREVAADRGFKFAYLRDESQDVGRQLGAVSTPEFFVLNQDRVVIYRGAWDDGRADDQVKERYVEAAVAAALAGKKPAVAETKAAGCSISYKSAR